MRRALSFRAPQAVSGEPGAPEADRPPRRDPLHPSYPGKARRPRERGPGKGLNAQGRGGVPGRGPLGSGEGSGLRRVLAGGDRREGRGQCAFAGKRRIRAGPGRIPLQ